ncbi:MAG: hypothetical protein PVH68_06705 [Armatimonadota bacterium]|jgi:hypothetical protein
MPWKPNKRLLQEGFPDLKYLPKGRSAWDCTLSALAYGIRRELGDEQPDLNAWAARHAAPASGRYRELASDALVLWHGTSRERAEKVIEHGLFHKRGVWTAADPRIAHGYCRGRSERFATEGAVVCLVLDRSRLTEGLHFDVDGPRNVHRFHAGLPPDVVEYILLHDEIRFTGDARSREPRPWTTAKFKRHSGRWVPAQKTPVRYSESQSYSSVQDFVQLTVGRLLADLVSVTALEVFSTVYTALRPADAVTHADVFDAIEQVCVACGPRRNYRVFRGATAPHARAATV